MPINNRIRSIPRHLALNTSPIDLENLHRARLALQADSRVGRKMNSRILARDLPDIGLSSIALEGEWLSVEQVVRIVRSISRARVWVD